MTGAPETSVWYYRATSQYCVNLLHCSVIIVNETKTRTKKNQYSSKRTGMKTKKNYEQELKKNVKVIDLN